MGFKADTSFLRFLSMGAAGARQVMAQMRAAGFEPIELERYCTSNKIWTTKVKRLRLPDLLCVRTGTRVEVRAKTDLKIRMSDAPANPDRRWNSGMRNDDLAAFIACFDQDGTPCPAPEAVFFNFGDLQKTEGLSALGPPKSASEGAERDRTWSCIVPQRNGVVDFVDKSTIIVIMDPDEERPMARRQTFQLRGKSPYVSAGDRFIAESSIIAGIPSRRIEIKTYLKNTYDPLSDMGAKEAVDRYAAVKSLPFLAAKRKQAVEAIEKRLEAEKEDRVLLEAAGAGTALESAKAWEKLEGFVWSQQRPDLRMEAVFILTELKSAGARDVLIRIANDPAFAGNEIRQAAVWGLGKAGLKHYGDLVPFLRDGDRDVVLHAVAAFGSEASALVVAELIAELTTGDEKRAPAASEALRVIGNQVVLTELILALRQKKGADGWLLATLGRLPADKVRSALKDDPLLARLEPLLLLSHTSNWMAEDSVDIDLKFLMKQDL
ncbi:MAG: hypothetical protein E6G97_26175 [Alphaproteobacteria bacterium]|nr:MAG: hypothetical protein E6G97_26175 [Alphaproteobacteria bacterium]